MFLPVGEPRGQGLPLEPAALPDREVGVLDRKVGQIRRTAADARAVELRELREENPERPVVRNDVVQRDQEPVLLGSEPDQTRAQERRAGEIERPFALFRGECPRFLHAFGRGPLGEVGHGERQRHRLDSLRGLAVRRFEAGAQDLVPLDDLSERPFERCDVERALERVGLRDVVEGRSGNQLIEEPEALLSEGERSWRAGVAAGDV
jgi:hypothetical protein